MKRTAIILDRNLTSGEMANISSILLADITHRSSGLFSDTELFDNDKIPHATPNFSVVILKAKSPTQLRNSALNFKAEKNISLTSFSKVGQRINNDFNNYSKQIQNLNVCEIELSGVAVSGEDEIIRNLTKKFSVL